jgi:TolB-like protein/class 3 adenylate cyclase
VSDAEEERRLAAIMVADAVGYSRLVEADEKHALTALRNLRSQVIDPAVARHHGRIFKPTGDGILAEFASVVAAVQAAVDIQRRAASAQADVAPERRLVLRIGINLGDVVVEGHDLLGHGVNVAARLEQICQPGHVYVSGSARDQLDGKLEFGLDWIGKQHVKNITRPVRVYSVRLHDPGRRSLLPVPKLRRWLPWAAGAAISLLLMGAGAIWFWPGHEAAAGSSMVVLPFENLSNDAEQGYLADGISVDLTTELARVPGLFVLSRTAAFAYKDTEKDPQRIARELGVRYILDGSVRRIGDDIRINAQLVDATTGGHLWAQRYDGAWSDVLVLQDKVVSEVATALELRLAAPAAGATPGGTTNVAAYDAFLRGAELVSRGSPHDFAEAIGNFNRAIELDPAYGQAMAELAWVYYISTGNDERQRALGTGTLETIGLSQLTFERAMKHPSARGYQLAGERHINHWEPEMAISDLDRAIALDPSNVWNYRQKAKAEILGGDPAEGLTFIDTSLRVDPREHQWTTSLRGLAEFSLERYADAAASLEKTLAGPAASNYDNLLPLMAAYGKLGEDEKARGLMKALDAYSIAYGDGGVTALLAAQYIPFAKLDDVLRFQDGLIKAGIPELPFGLDPKSEDRLSGDEMHALIYGHIIAGRVLELSSSADIRMSQDYKVGVPWSVTTSADGSSVSYVWGDVSNGGGHIHHEGDRDCFYFAYEKACAAIFRNPSGTREQQNEYYWFHHWYRIAFSVEK